MSQAFKDHFSCVAGRYADFRPHYPAELFDYLAGLVPKNATVWDCAAGSGQATLDLAARLDRVIATDASREQIAAASLRPNIEYRLAPAEHSGLADASVSLVTVAQALHWFDLPRFYGEVKRVMQPNGLLAVWAYGINQVEGGAVDTVSAGLLFKRRWSLLATGREDVGEIYRTIVFPFAEITPPSFRMEAQWTLGQLLGYFSTWSATTRFIKARGLTAVTGMLLGEMAKVLGPTPKIARAWSSWPLILASGPQAVNRIQNGQRVRRSMAGAFVATTRKTKGIFINIPAIDSA